MLPYLTALFVCFDSETISDVGACVLRASTKKVVNFLRKKCIPEKILATPLSPGDLA